MGPLRICDLCRERGRECVWPPSAAGRAKACNACVLGKAHCVVGPPKARPLKCDREAEGGSPPAKHAKAGDVFVVESGSASEWTPPEDPHWKAREYLSMQMADQTRVLERSTHALEGIASIAMASLNVARERAAAARGPRKVDRGVGPEEPAPAPTAEKGALFEPEALDD